MQKISDQLIIFIVIAIILFTIMVIFILTILYLNRKSQLDFEKSLTKAKLDNEKAILSTQIEIQEQTFQHISKEIHDNINLSLTLAKLNLNTLDWTEIEKVRIKTENSIELISQSIIQLSDLSKSLDASSFSQQGLLGAIQEELQRINRTVPFRTDYRLTGNPVYMNSETELVIFRIIQEAFNNIIKHAGTEKAVLLLHYHPDKLQITVRDEGNGFDTDFSNNGQHAGLKNMRARVEILGGEMALESRPGKGTTLNFIIPFSE